MSGSGAVSSPPEEDELSVATTGIENCTISHGSEAREYVVKFQFKPLASETNTEVAKKTHFDILQAITDIYPEALIFDNYGHSLSNLTTLTSNDIYLHHFKLQFVRANEQKKRQLLYLAFHRIRSTVPITEICRHSTIARLLLKVNTRLAVHLWSKEETRIATLGFHVGVDPSNFLKDHFEERIRSQISSATVRAKKHIPRFQCSFTSPFLINNNGRTSTKSYDIQCSQKDAKELVYLLRQTYQKKPSFDFHKLCHSDPHTYKQAIRTQNRFLSSSRVVPVQGIDEDLMFYLEQDLLQVAGVHAILHHRDTASKGRWSILTTESHFRTISNTLRDNLPRWAEYYANEVHLSDALPSVGLAFKNSAVDSTSDQAFKTYASACSSVYTLQDDSYDDPPANVGPFPQAWDNIPTSVRSTEASSIPSGVSQDEFNRVNQENTRLSRRVEDLTAQVQTLLARLPSEATCASSPRSISMSNTDIQSIITATVQAVLRELNQHMAQESAPVQEGDMSFGSPHEDTNE